MAIPKILEHLSQCPAEFAPRNISGNINWYCECSRLDDSMTPLSIRAFPISQRICQTISNFASCTQERTFSRCFRISSICSTTHEKGKGEGGIAVRRRSVSQNYSSITLFILSVSAVISMPRHIHSVRDNCQLNTRIKAIFIGLPLPNTLFKERSTTEITSLLYPKTQQQTCISP